MENENEVLKKELTEAREALLKVQAENHSLIGRSLKVYEENQMYKASPALAMQMAEMEFQLKMAERFIASKAFKAANAEQAYVIIKAGAEMGMAPVESMQALYCVNGNVKFWGDKMVGRIIKHGYKIEYLNDSGTGVTVKVTHPETGFEAAEQVDINDQILKKSNAMGFAAKNKMRFHGVRMLASFHLAHLFGSVTDEFTPDFNEWQDGQKQLPSGGIDITAIDATKERNRILSHINAATSLQQLEKVRGLVSEFDLADEFEAKHQTLQPE